MRLSSFTGIITRVFVISHGNFVIGRLFVIQKMRPYCFKLLSINILRITQILARRMIQAKLLWIIYRKEQKIKPMKNMTLIAKTSPDVFDGAPVVTREPAKSKRERFFLGIVSGSLALAFGFAFASIQSLDMSAAGFSFRFSSGTLLAFLVGALVGSIYGKILSLGSSAGASSLLRGATALLVLGAAGGFLYPLRFLSRERLVEVLHGLGIVAVALSLVGYMLWRIKGFLENDMAQAEIEAKERGAGQ